MNDIVTPNFTSLQKRGHYVDNRMDYSRVTRGCRSSSLQFVQTLPVPNPNATKLTFTGYYGAYQERYVPTIAFPDPNLVDQERLIALACIAARNGIAPIALQGLTSVAELPKTLSLIASVLQRLRQVRQGCKRGNLRLITRALGVRHTKGVNRRAWLKKSLEERWLEFRYGISPLVYDVQGAVKALDPDRDLTPRLVSRATRRDVQKSGTVVNRDQTWYGLFKYTFANTEDIQVRAYCHYKADMTYLPARDFGLTELPLTAWELVPFSFVVDWFVNIGDWLEALTPKLGIKILSEGYTVKRKLLSLRTVSWTKQTVSGNSYDASGSFLNSVDECERLNVYRVPYIDILYTIPPVNIKINVKRAIDAIALFGKMR
jgi:hypothetical protein